MNNLINLLSKYNGKVARIVCHQSFVNLIIGMRTPTQVEVEVREDYHLELTDGRVVHQDGSVDELPLTQLCTASSIPRTSNVGTAHQHR